MRSRQAGDSKIGCVLWLIAFAISGMVAYKLIPVRIKAAELTDFMEEQAKWAARQKVEDIKKSILDRAKQLELPLDEKNVKVERSGDRIRMEATYTVPVEFPGYVYNWEFHTLVDRPIFIV